ncbi:MAG: exonuclease SbcCD subunit D [Anaerolineae bacterium]
MNPINLLHLADIHIGMENYGRFDTRSGLNSRVVDFLRRMSEAIDYALAREVDVCIFAGDAYKNQRPNPTYQREFARRIKRLADAGVPVILLVGNHDMPAAHLAASSIDIFGILDVPNVIIAAREEVHQVTCRRGQPLQVATVPYPLRSRLLVHDQFKNMTIEELDQALVDIVSDNIRTLAAEAVEKPDLPAILTGHFSVSEARQGSEQSVMIGRDVIILKSVLADPVWDYVAMGHIHKHQELNNGARPPIVYPGSLERIDFGEEREPKGFVWVELDTERRQAAWEFVRTKSRRFLTIRLDVTGSDDPMPDILDAIEAHDVDEAIVRVIITAREEQEPLIEDRPIRQALGQASFIASIVRDVTRLYRKRLGDHSIEELTPAQALELYLEVRETPPDRKEVLLKHAEEIFREG